MASVSDVDVEDPVSETDCMDSADDMDSRFFLEPEPGTKNSRGGHVDDEDLPRIKIPNIPHPEDYEDAEDLKGIRRKLKESMISSWEEVVKIYDQDPRAHKIRMGLSMNTALHKAISSGREDTVEQLVKLIVSKSKNPVGVLSVGNAEGNNPLHLAASMGSIRMCKCIVGDNYKQLLGTRNSKSETPLFSAARHGKKDAFLWLYEMCDGPAQAHQYCRSHYDDVLHLALEGGHFDLAFEIIHRQEGLVDSIYEDGISPLHVLANKPTAFRSGTHLRFFSKIIYDCIFVEELIPGTSNKEEKNLFQGMRKMIKLPGKSNNKYLDAENPGGGQGHHSSNRAQEHRGHPSSYYRCLRFIKLIVSKTLLLILPMISGSKEIRKLKEKKEMHIWSLQIMNKLLEHVGRSDYEMNPKNDETSEPCCYSEYGYFRRDGADETPILLASRNGILEMVENTLKVFPLTIYDLDKHKNNIVLLAVENRQSHVYQFLLKSSTVLGESLAFHALDEDKVGALYLASKREKDRSRLILTSMLQMQWEVKWYEYVKNSLLPDFVEQKIWYILSSDEVFRKNHQELEDESKQWLNNTSNSCSFIAALIATVAFASSATVPGGVDGDTGKPIFERHLAFRIFAISSLVALCSSFISLLIFFTFLTFKYQYRDFSKRLPRNLLLALTCLFISIAAMLLCFCSGHFLMLEDGLRYAAIPVYAVTSFAVLYFSLQQVPSYFVLLKSTFQNVPEKIYDEYL